MRRVVTSPTTGTRLAEPVAALCLVSDLGRGLADGQGLRSCVLAMRVADLVGLGTDERRVLFWVGLLRFVGCTATATDMAAALGDELRVSAAFADSDQRDLPDVFRRAGRLSGGHPGRLATFLSRAPAVIRDHEVTSCEVAQSLASELGLPPDVRRALGQVFERYDGKGHPGVVSGLGLHPGVRTWQVAHTLDLLGGHLSPGEVRAQLRRRAGGALDAAVVELVVGQADALLDEARDGGTLGDLLAVEPEPVRTVAEHELDKVLDVLGLVADAKSPYFRGHSAAVADLAAKAARVAGRSEEEVRDAHQAGAVADIGKVAVSSRIWNSPGPLSDAEWEQVRLHPYFTQRVLSRVPSLAGIVDAACSHHERGGGVGYHRGLRSLSGTAALVAVADAWVTKGERRSYREGLTVEQREAWLRAETAEGRLPGGAVDAVLAASGIAPRPPRAAAGCPLSPREVAVLDLVADGLTNRAVGHRLGISPKTVNAHLEHAYT